MIKHNAKEAEKKSEMDVAYNNYYIQRKHMKEEGQDLSDEEQPEKYKELDEQQRKEMMDRFKEKAERAFTYEKLVKGLKEGKFKKIVVCTGAGISVSAGIPDFRSPKTGLYSNLEKYDLPNPQAIFEIEFFKKKPEAFYQLANEFLDL